MIKIDLITGFLGAGKTTFLLKYARYLMKQGLRIGILEYDYSSINVDMVLLNPLRGENCELEMLAACCDQTSLQRRFQTKLIAMAMSGYDRVIVEPSGVFDMDVFFDILRDEPLENWYEIGSVITIVNGGLLTDKVNTRAADDSAFFLASQAISAGCVVMSRTQLVTPEAISATKAYIHEAASAIGCEKFRENYMEKPWDELTDDDFRMISKSGYQIHGYRKVTAGRHSEYESVAFLKHSNDLQTLQEKLALLFEKADNGDGKEDGEEGKLGKTEEAVYFGQIDRVKGFLRNGNINYQINATPYETILTPISMGPNSLIVIGRDLQEEAIRALIGE